MPERYIGLDVATTGFVACIATGEEKRLSTVTFSADDQQLDEFLSGICPGDRVVLEAGTGAFHLADRLAQTGCEYWILNPYRIALITRSARKTDRHDAETLALLARRWTAEDLHLVRVPDESERRLRALVQNRAQVAKMRRQNMQRLWHLAVDNGIHGLPKRSMCKPAIRRRVIDELPEWCTTIGERWNRLIDELEDQLRSIETEMTDALRCQAAENVENLASIFGVGPVTMATVLAYASNMDQFNTPEAFASYCGLTPRVDNSGDKVRHGAISKLGPPNLRTALVEAVWVMVRHKQDNAITRMYRDVKSRRGVGRAVIAAARKLAMIIWILLTRNCYFEDADPKWVRKKLTEYRLL